MAGTRAYAARAGAPLRIVQVANLNRVKDQETLLDALHMLAARGVAFELDVIGLDTLGGTVQRRCHDLGLADRVRFHGFVEHDAVRPFIERADLMVVSSRHEGVPIASLEAAVAGVPTVGTAVGQIADWAPDAAIAVPIGDPRRAGRRDRAAGGRRGRAPAARRQRPGFRDRARCRRLRRRYAYPL